MVTWPEHVEKWRDCEACPLHKQRCNIVLARGQVPCDLLFVGEAPGASEDALALPFVGAAGRLLDAIVERALGDMSVGSMCDRLEMSRDTPYWALKDLAEEKFGDYNMLTCAYTNLVACFPSDAKRGGYNEPEVAEIMACRPRLVEFMYIAQPRLLVRVGSLAKDYAPVRDESGKVVRCVSIIHPAAILRMPLAQQHMALQRCIMQIRIGIDDMLAKKPIEVPTDRAGLPVIDLDEIPF